jgi:type II secretory pathway pseudopilin PulG
MNNTKPNSLSPGAQPSGCSGAERTCRDRLFLGSSPFVRLCSLKAALLPRSQAFTMIEITISLAIIGFALVAIIGVLPLGMTAQRDNRQETIVNQDASVLMDAVRNGERGLDDLTNYVVGITNYSRQYTRPGLPGQTFVWGYSVQGSIMNGALSTPQYPLTNGYSIVGLLSTPKIKVNQPGGVGFVSNHVVAVFRSLSGPASEKPPQLNPTMQELGLSYRVVADVSGYGTNFFFPTWTNFSQLSNTNDIAIRSNYMVLVQNLQTNLHDLRLTFLWPMLPSGKVGGGRQVYRTMVAGRLVQDPTNNFNSPFFFFQPRTYY